MLFVAPARAADATDARAEAARRYDHAMALLDQGDDAGALAELERVYAIAPHPQVLYNLGLAYAATNRPVEAARALDEVLAAPGALPADRLTRARRTRDEQARRVARLAVTTNVPATIEIDGVEVGTTPLADGAPLAVAAGRHTVAALASGYLPVRREITVAGEVTERLALELAPTELRLAHLAVRAALPGADVIVDGQPVGRTPLPGTIAVPPGRRVVELRRAGYLPAQKDVTLDDGASAELSFQLAEDAGSRTRGRLTLAVSEPDPDVSVDGQRRSPTAATLDLPAGPHVVEIARGGFVPSRRLIVVPEGGEALARVTLEPTPETRLAYKERTQARRRWGWGGIVGGAALAVAGGITFALNRGPLGDAEARIATLRPSFEPGAHCAMGGDNYWTDPSCKPALDAADDNYNRHKTAQNFALVGLGVGVAAIVAGAVLIATGDDPARYDEAPHDRSDGFSLSAWGGASAGGLALAGRF
jgi:hypothetical protein